MAGNPLHTVLDHIRRLHRVADSSQRSDRELLRAFATDNDQDAFALVVTRHAPLVWGVCRRILGHHHDAEDAFQATFLILARRARSVRWQSSVGGWLHTVAQRLAVRAREQAQQRRIQERQASQASSGDTALRELAAVVDEELRRLPAKYREPLLLHYLDGATAETVARRLGLSRAAFYNRLTRGRELLRERLSRQGLSLAAPLLAAALTAEAEAASRSLIQATMQVVRGAVPERVAALAARALSVTAIMRLKVGMTLGLLLGVAAGGVAMLTPHTPRSQHPQAERPAEPPKAEDKAAIRVDRYGDPLPPGAVARLGSLRFHVPDQIKALAFAPDGKTLAASSYAGMYVIDATSGRRIKRLPTLGRSWSPEDHLAISPDSKRLLSIGPKVGNNGKGVIHDWDLNGEGPPREYERKGAGLVAWLGWSAKGEPLAICDERKAVLLYELATGGSRRFSCKAESGDFGSSVFAYTPAGQTLALVDNGNAIHIWDTVTGRERCVLQPKDTLVRHLAFASDGRALASLNADLPLSNRRSIQLWDAVTGKLLHTVRMEEKDIALISFSPDGKTLATAGRSGVRFWDVMAGTEKRRAQGEGLDMQSIAFSGDGRTFAAVERHTGAFQLWDVASDRRKTMPVGHGAAPYGASFSSDGRRVVSCCNVDGTIYVWDAADGEPLLCIHRHGQWARDALFSEDGRSIYSAWTAEDVWISDAANGKRRRVLTMEDPERPDTKQSAWSLRLSDDNKQLIALSYFYMKTNAFPRKAESLITGWDTSSHKQLFRRRFPGEDTRLVLSADARLLVAPYPPMDAKAIMGKEVKGLPIEQTLRLEDAATGETLLTFPIRDNPPSPLAFSPDGRLLATYQWERKPGATTSTVQLWETATGTIVQTLPGATHSKVAFSPDGRLLLSMMSHPPG
jgi:RNA polymerase sigma factor (sigma-70 family)